MCLYNKVTKKYNKSVLWIKIHDIRDKLGVKIMSDLTIKETKGKYNTESLIEKQFNTYKKHGPKLINGKNFMYIHEGIALQIIIHCRIPTAIGFRSKLGLKQHDLIMTKEQSLLKR